MDNVTVLILTQVIASVGTIAVLKTDISWLKNIVAKHDSEISKLQNQN